MKFLLTMIIAMVFTTGVYANDHITKEEGCEALAYNIIQPIAKVRDQGWPPEQAVMGLVQVGMPAQLAVDMVAYVYFDRPNSTPEEVGNEVLNKCLGGPA